MTMRASSTALRLLHELVETGPGGRVFTSEEAISAGTAIRLSLGHVYKLLSELTTHGAIDRPRGHLYVMQTPFGGTTPVRPLAIAARAVHPAAVSGDTAVVPIFDRERTIVEVLANQTPAAVELAAELIDSHRDDLDFTRMQKYADRLGIADLPELDGSTAISLS